MAYISGIATTAITTINIGSIFLLVKYKAREFYAKVKAMASMPTAKR